MTFLIGNSDAVVEYDEVKLQEQQMVVGGWCSSLTDELLSAANFPACCEV